MYLMGHLEIKEDIKGSREVGMNVIKIHEILKEIMIIFLIKT